MNTEEKRYNLKHEPESEMKIRGFLAQIGTPKELVRFLKNKGNNHRRYFHYTGLESLVCMLEHKTFRMAWANSGAVNDLQEKELAGTQASRSHLYTGSFGYGAMERVAMWGLYGQPREMAVRILIPQAKMTEWVKRLNIKEWQDKIRPASDNSEDEIKMEVIHKFINQFYRTDMLYVRPMRDDGKVLDRKGWPFFALRWLSVQHDFELQDNSEISTMFKHLGDYPLRNNLFSGIVKHQCWEYEQEVRLVMKIHESSNESEDGLNVPDKIDIPVPKEILQSMLFCWGPNVDVPQMKRIEELIEAILGPLPEEDSETRKVRFDNSPRERFCPSLVKDKLQYRIDDVGSIWPENPDMRDTMGKFRQFIVREKLEALIRRLEAVLEMKRRGEW